MNVSDPDQSAAPNQPPKRHVRSFVRRDGRVTASQKLALENLSERYQISPGDVFDSTQRLFLRDAPLVVEIGFGDGDNLVAQACSRPDVNFIGCEPYLAGVGRVMSRLDAAGLTNVRLVADDAVPFISDRLSPSSVSGWMIFFPDPWPKKRHHKRRLLNAEFLTLLATRSAPRATLKIATDWPDYADQIATAIPDAPGWRWLNPGAPGLRPASRPLTRFERRGIRAGNPIRDFLLIRD